MYAAHPGYLPPGGTRVSLAIGSLPSPRRPPCCSPSAIKCAIILHIMRKKFNSPADAATFGGKIRQARLDRGLTLSELGAEVSVDHSQISRYERGQMSSVSKNLQRICTFLHVNDDPYRCSAPSSSLGRKVDELLRHAPGCEPALAKLVEAIEVFIATIHVPSGSSGSSTPPRG
ncbi:helix-turn-helix domain-containing protein [Pseudomonas allii]|uniref:helix-turn-helix domain-containing protein n=1 Tax=Pseudomonas allii TaxID=2740531 RepID=UPI003CC64166